MRPERQNVTISLPKRLLKRAKVVAAQHETSVTAIVNELLEAYVEREDGAADVRTAALGEMRRGLGYRVGTGGWSREALHGR